MVTARIGDRLDNLVTQIVVGLVAAAIALMGVMSLAIAACVALAEVWGVPLAALTIGVSLVLIALIAWLVVRDSGPRRASPAPKVHDAPPVAASAAEIGAALAAGVQSRPKEAALVALLGGLIAGSSPGLRRNLERLID
jgi:hypothetical protein